MVNESVELVQDDKKSQNMRGRGLYALLGVLCVVIVGLAIGIVVANNHDGEKEASDNACIDKEDVDEFISCVDDAYADDWDTLLNEYSMAIQSAKDAGNYDRAGNLVIARSDFFLGSDDCDAALELYGEDLDGIEPKQLARIYSVAVSVSIDCGNDAAKIKYQEMSAKAMSEVKDALAF